MRRTRPSFFLVWKDGRKEPTEYGGGIRIYHAWVRDDGRTMQTTFDRDDSSGGDDWLYVETDSEDITARLREGAERERLATFRRLGIRPPAMTGAWAQGRYPGETEDEAKRRIRIANGEEP